MNKIIHKVASLCLVLLITLLVLHYSTIVTFSNNIRDLLCFITLALIIFSATSGVCIDNNNLNKFINYMILLGTFVGMTLYIIQGTLNYVIYATILLTLISSLMDMFCKKP